MFMRVQGLQRPRKRLLGFVAVVVLGDRIRGTLGDIDPLNKVPV